MAINLNVFDILEQKNNKYYQAPGTLSYEGKFKEEMFHGEVIVYNSHKHLNIEFKSVEELIDILNEYKHVEEHVLWVNIVGLSDIASIEKIGSYFTIPRLFLEDIVHVSKHSKIEVLEKQLFCVLQMIYQQQEEILKENLSIFFEGNTVIIFQESDGDIFDPMRQRLLENKGLLRKSKAEYLFYEMMDTLVDNFLIVAGRVEMNMDTIEELIIDFQDINMSEIYNLKKQLLLLKTTIFPIQNIKYILREQGGHIISSDMEPFFNDLDDHINQLVNEINIQREIISNLFETHMLNVSNDMNKVMTTLTVYSAIFIPLSFLAGVFGMNFDYIPGLKNPYGFFIFVFICITVAVGMILFFKKKKWF